MKNLSKAYYAFAFDRSLRVPYITFHRFLHPKEKTDIIQDSFNDVLFL